MAPIFFSIAGRLSDGKNALAVAQLSFINTCAIYLAKTTLAWVAQLTSITFALVLTGIFMSFLIYFAIVTGKQIGRAHV